MRTKTMLISALLGGLSSVAVMAQTNVYSINTVGYMNVTLANGWNIVTVPLITATDTNGSYNTVNDIFPNDPTAPTNSSGIRPFTGDTLYFLAPGASGYTSTTGKQTGSSSATGWTSTSGASSTTQILPGMGFWYERAGASTNVTVVGTVPSGPYTNTLVDGFNLVGSAVPLVGDLYSNAIAGNDGVHGFTNVLFGDGVELFDINAQQFVGTYQVVNAGSQAGNGSSPWKLKTDSGDPIITNVFEGFFYVMNTSGSNNWVENYSSAQP